MRERNLSFRIGPQVSGMFWRPPRASRRKAICRAMTGRGGETAAGGRQQGSPGWGRRKACCAGRSGGRRGADGHGRQRPLHGVQRLHRAARDRPSYFSIQSRIRVREMSWWRARALSVTPSAKCSLCQATLELHAVSSVSGHVVPPGPASLGVKTGNSTSPTRGAYSKSGNLPLSPTTGAGNSWFYATGR